MEVFRELTIRLGSVAPTEFVAVLERNLAKGWARGRASESQLRSFGAGATQYCFDWAGDADVPAASLWLAEKAPGLLYAANIVPQKMGKLSRKEYNGILMLFAETAVAQTVKALPAELNVTGDSASAQDLMPAPVADDLKRFSFAANKSTGSAHPNDMMRWCQFIIDAHRNGCDLDGATLSRVLQEELGWCEEVASGLVSEYEFGRELLRHYDPFVTEK